MNIRFYPIDVTYKVVRDAAVIQLYGRTDDNRQICVTDDTFEPYFWIVTDDKAAVESLAAKTQEGDIKVKKAELHRKRYGGKEVSAIKAFAYLPSDVPALREAAAGLGKCLEADIPFTRRYLIDRSISPLSLCEAEGEFISQRSKVPVFKAVRIAQTEDVVLQDFRVLALDIETHSKFGSEIVPESQPIIMLALAGDNFRKVITWKQWKTELDYVEFVDSELGLIERFKQLLEEYKPDMLAGYFSDGFDLPYISTRAEKYKIPLDIGLDYSSLKIGRRQNKSAEITGISHFDVFMFVKRIFGRSMATTSYGLDSVAMEILNEGKHEVDLSNLYNSWETNTGLEDFCRYNLQDAELTLKLARKLLPNLTELVKIVGLTPYEVSRMSFSQLVEWYLMNEAKHFNELAPNRPEYSESRQRIESTYAGAYVFEPVPGLYNDIVVFDFRSLYPSIISAHNISPETMNCGCCVEQDTVPGDGMKSWFCRNKKGFISTMIEGLIKRRMRIKEIMKTAEDTKLLKARAEALKTIANSMYGYMGFFGARWYSLECARSITAYGRHYIMKVIEKAGREFKVLYSDTDSIFLALEGKTRQDAENFVNEINSTLPGLMELDYEGFYPSGLFVATKEKGYGAKKKYALISEEGGIRIKGFEAIRRNLSMISREVQENVIRIILREHDEEKARRYVKETIEAIRQKTIPSEKMIINTQLQKEVMSYSRIMPPHVAVARRMKEQGKRVGSGSVISYVVVSGKDKIRDRARLPSEIKEGDYDPEYYVYNQVIPAVEKIFDVFGTNILEYAEPRAQKKLDSFFG